VRGHILSIQFSQLIESFSAIVLANFFALKGLKMKNTSWEHVAHWYDGWVGKEGSYYHRTIAIPKTLELLNLQPNEFLLDIGSGTGTLAPHVLKIGCHYVGIELSPSFVRQAKRYHSAKARFLGGDARHLQQLFPQQKFDAAVFLLSLQDMEPLSEVLENVSSVLKTNGRLVMFMIHPCFRVPRQSGWGFDEKRKLHYRRIDRYLSRLAVPMKSYRGSVTRSYHRPLQDYVQTLLNTGFQINAWEEIADASQKPNGQKNPNEEIPLFLALRAVKM
jgi:ubiquinone/menaquinone biosynthesis C-methylase UbiE